MINQSDNPFADVMSKMQNMGGGMMGGPQGAAPQGEMMDDGQEPDNQLMPGHNPDSSQQLLSALKSIQNYITDSTDPDEIAMARRVIMLLTQLIQRSQNKLTEQLPKDQEMLPRHQEMMKRAAMAKRILK